MWTTIGKWLFPWLLKRAMKLGARAFGRIDTRRHGLLSRRWMYEHIWRPTIAEWKLNQRDWDDVLATFVEANQMTCLEDGTAMALIGSIRQAICSSDSVGALQHLRSLQTTLGLGKDDPAVDTA